ncbi:recombinase family protein [Crassaminicella profunda]|uniref:recombinase family protein n=1 Tax=Crassaminicella profunda TaxID=1286698 RepID=UPI001CA743C2|nr:recombinase family protein [Crassaminicella profunda]QZY56496.1 recombinase family protein [Crassaminicella profunda]
MKKRVIGYTRVSTQMQADEGLSLEAQKTNLEDYCKRYDYEFLGIYQDAGLSGKNTNRPELMKLIHDAQKKLFDIVLVWKISRISRNLKDLLTIVEDLEKHDIALISCTEPFDTSTHLGKAFLQILGTFAELERNTLAENVKMSLIDNAKKGKWNGGLVYGYDAVDGELFVNEEESAVVKKIYDLYIQGWGYGKIINHLNSQYIKSKRGAAWTLQQIKRTLSNPIYIGEKSYNKIIDKGTNPRVNPKEEAIIIHENSHIPIIEQSRFELVQRLIKSKSLRKQNLKHIHLLSGILKCPYCHEGMVTKRAGGKKVDGVRVYRNYYQCQTYHNKRGCRSFLVNEEKMEADVLEHLVKFFSDEEIVRFTLMLLNKKINKKNQPLQEKLSEIEKELHKNREEINNLIHFISKTPNIDHTQFEEEVQKRQKEIELLQKERMKNLQRVNGNGIEEIDIDRAMKYVRKIKDTLENCTDRETLRRLIATIVSDVLVDENKELVEIKVWFNNITELDSTTIRLPLGNSRERERNYNSSN